MPERAGVRALSLFSVQVNVDAIEALAAGPESLIDLRRAIGAPPETTMRARMRELTELGIVDRRRQPEFPGSIDYALTDAGREFAELGGVLGTWLAAAPYGAAPLGSAGATSALKALISGWSSTMVRALAARPLSLTQLDSLISGLSYPALERRLTAMRLAGQLQPTKGRGRGSPHAVTDWLRRAVGPLLTAICWEQRNLGGTSTALSERDAETVLLLATPLVRVAPDLRGLCRIAVRLGRDVESRFAGVEVEIEEGRIVACTSRLERKPDAWVTGTPRAWLSALADAQVDRLELRGDRNLAVALAEQYGRELFGRIQGAQMLLPKSEGRPAKLHSA